MSFKYETIGKKTPKDCLAQATELPLRGVLIMGMVEGVEGGWVMQDCGLTVPDLMHIVAVLNARMNAIATQLLVHSTTIKGPEDFEKS